jgi:hypothetical protein
VRWPTAPVRDRDDLVFGVLVALADLLVADLAVLVLAYLPVADPAHVFQVVLMEVDGVDLGRGLHVDGHGD